MAAPDIPSGAEVEPPGSGAAAHLATREVLIGGRIPGRVSELEDFTAGKSGSETRKTLRRPFPME
jgi:hypothetical protein